MASFTDLTAKHGSPWFRCRVNKGTERYTGHASTKAKAQRIAEAKMREGKAPTPPDARQTFAEYMATWLEPEQHDWAPSTLRGAAYLWQQHLSPTLGRYRLCDLNYAALQQCVNKVPTPYLKGRCRKLLKRVLGEAVDMLGLEGNPATRLRVPKHVTRKFRTWQPEQVVTFLEGTRGHPFEAVWVLSLAFPARPGEIEGLEWGDIEWATGRLHVKRSASTYMGKTDVKKPKTARPPEGVPLFPEVVAFLKHWRLVQAEQKLKLGRDWTAGDRVCSGPKGGKLLHQTVRKAFRREAARLGLPVLSTYELRHTACSVMLNRGVPIRVVADLAGHNDVKTTAKYYWQAEPGADVAAVDVLAQAFYPRIGEETGAETGRNLDAAPK